MRRRRAQDVSSATAGNNTHISWKHQVQKQLKQCQLTNALSGDGHASLMTRSIAPMAIIGGTFSVYSSAMKVSHKNSDLTPLSILYLLLLALNYAIMPRLSRRFIHPKTNKRSVALAEELVKMTLGLGGWVMSSYVAASDLESTTSIVQQCHLLQPQYLYYQTNYKIGHQHQHYLPQVCLPLYTPFRLY